MTRRQFLTAAAMAPAFASGAPAHTIGIAATSYLTAWRPRDTMTFLEHCHALGAAGIQAPLNGDLAAIRSRAESYGMYIEGMVALPKNGDTTAFEAAVKNARAVNAVCLRAGALSGRRYETFSTLADWSAFADRTTAALDAAVPILEKYRVPLALENHKDWTADELAAKIRKYSSAYLGVCLDFGNNISLLDSPEEYTRILAPLTFATHVKDMAVAPAEDGFLLSEVPLGQGLLDLPAMLAAVRQARPQTRFSLEMITRDPLRVPCLTDKYWTTFPDRGGIYLARTLRLVRDRKSATPLPEVKNLSHEEQLAAEENNVKLCMAYAHEHLGL